MPGSNRTAYGNETYDLIIAPTSQPGATPGTLVWSSATVAATTTAEVTFALPGAQLGDAIDLYLTTGPITTGLQIGNIRVSAPNVVAVTWINTTAGSLTIPTTGWIANVTRPETPFALPTNLT